MKIEIKRIIVWPIATLFKTMDFLSSMTCGVFMDNDSDDSEDNPQNMPILKYAGTVLIGLLMVAFALFVGLLIICGVLTIVMTIPITVCSIVCVGLLLVALSWARKRFNGIDETKDEGN